MKIKNGELEMLLEGLKLVKSKINPQANYNITKNKLALSREIEEYRKDILEIQKRHFVCDENGELEITNGNQLTYLEEGREEHIKQYRKEIEEYNSVMADVKILTITMDDVLNPVETLNQEEMDGIVFMVVEDEDTEK